MFRMISMIYKHLWDNYMKLFNNLFYLLIFQRWSVTPERKKSRSEDLDKILEFLAREVWCPREAVWKAAGLLRAHDGPAES